jgi:outer membrane autotransporter protein
LVHAFAQGADASATGIGVIAAETTITNSGGTIWAGISTDGGSTIQRGLAIDTVNSAGLVQLQGTGHIYGDINLASGNTIEVTEGKTFFEGTIAGPEGTLDIFHGGKLVLCQEGWTDACDPTGWGDANWDPQRGVNGPSVVNIQTFNVAQDGTIVYQLTPEVNTHPQVNAVDASVNGTLVAQYLPGFYANSSSYEDLVVAGNSLNTDGLVVKDNSLLLKTTFDPGGNTIGLDVTRTKFNAVSGLSKNENAAASGIEHIYSKLPGVTVNPANTNSFDQLVARLFTIGNRSTYFAVLDQLTGAQFAQQLQSMVWSLRPLNESVNDRMDCSLNQPMVPVAQGYSYGCFRPGQFQTWARGWGGWNHNDGDINAPGYDEQQGAIWGGGDYGISDTFMIGFAGGFFHSNMDFDNFGGVPGGKIEYDGGQIAGYAAWDTTIWYNRAIVSGGFYSGHSHRNFALESSPVDPSGSPNGDAVSFYDELGRRFGVGSGVTLTPFAGVTASHAELDGFTENGNSGAELRIGGSDADSVASLFGLRLSGEWSGAFKPQVALAWEHEFDDTFQTITASFAGAPSGSNFKVRGTDLGEDTLVVDAGASYAFGPNNDFSVRYVGRFLEDYDAQSVMGRWTYKWGGAPVAAPPPVYTPLK